MPEYHILNLGAGVQSTTVYLLNHYGIITPRFDYAIFADTQEEPQAVYKNLKWLRSLGGPEILVRTAGKLGEDLIHGRNSTGQRFASIPAFTKHPSKKSPGRVRRQCTREYKIDVIERTIRREVLKLQPRKWIPRDVVVYQYYGISLDEARRSKRIEERSKETRWSHAKFPLLELGWTREDCKRYLRIFVPHETPRSACVFCPYRSDPEWEILKETDPVGWARACEIDEALRKEGVIINRKMNDKMYLHRSCQPLVSVVFQEQPHVFNQFTVAECEGMCGV